MPRIEFILAIIRLTFLHWLLRVGYILGGSLLITTTAIVLTSRLLLEFIWTSGEYNDLVLYAIGGGLLIFCFLLYFTRNWWISETVGEWERSGSLHASAISSLRRKWLPNKVAK